MDWNYTTKKAGLTVEQLLRDEWKLGKKLVHELRMAKGVSRLDGEPIRWNDPLPAGTVIRFSWPLPSLPYIPEMRSDIPVLFEDEHLLIVRKPKGIPTHPNEPGQTGTCLNAVIGYLAQKNEPYAEHVHRLDQGTSGLLLFAKHPAAKSVLDRMLENREINREYEAEVEGMVKKAADTIEAAIGKDRHHPVRRRVSPTGQHAVTHYRVIRRSSGTAKLRLKLDTGRTHQIRVHLSSIGHPIIGDELYGGTETADGHYALHAFRMSFIHPFTGEKVEVETE